MRKEKCKIISNTKLGDNIYELIIESGSISSSAKCGQFLNLYCASKTKLLPRPISVCEVNENKINLLYKVVGKGTLEFSKLTSSDTIDVLGPIGTGFEIVEGKKIALVGGGVGIAPLVELSKNIIKENVIALLGINNEFEKGLLKEDILNNECSKVKVATMDGSYGVLGNVIDLLKDEEVDYIYSCGPLPMLKAVQKYMIENNIKGQFSLEEKMGCGGLGACVGCVCKIKIRNGEDFKYQKVCEYGPVFDALEVMFDE